MERFKNRKAPVKDMGFEGAYTKLLNKLDDAYRGRSVEGLENSLQSISLAMSHGLDSDARAELDASNKAIELLRKYHELKNHRRTIEVAGAMRDTAPETDILENLRVVQGLMTEVVTPLVHRPIGLVSTLVHDNTNLSLGYVWSVTQSAAEGYIPLSDRCNAKLEATDIVRQAMDIERRYHSVPDAKRLEALKIDFKKMGPVTAKASFDFLRSYASNFTSPKNICHKNAHIADVCRAAIDDGYKPSFILPIAHGGIELGVMMDLAYRDAGFKPTTYPVLFSIKTRRHPKPLTEGDEPILDSLPQQDVLITEDWITTGNTALGVCAQVQQHFPNDLRFATIKQDPRSLKIPSISRFKTYAGVIMEYNGPKNDTVDPKTPPRL